MIRHVSDNPNLIQPPRWTRKSQAEAWVVKKYGWTKSEARSTSRAKLNFVWFNPGINWYKD